MMRVEYAMIGGTGVYEPGQVEDGETVTVETPYGSVPVTVGTYATKKVAFLARHGATHGIPPHKINYRANIFALKELGVTQILATAAVGSLQKAFAPGELLLADDVVDLTKMRESTFFDQGKVVHIDMSDPYCHRLRSNLQKAANRQSISMHDGGVYVCTEGPRFETKAEIDWYAKLGGSVVGMTSMPEVALAKEAEMCYAVVCMVTNYAAGLSGQALSHQEVVETMGENVHKIRSLFYDFIAHDDDTRTCLCKHAASSQADLG